MKNLIVLIIALSLTSCVSTQLTIKNIDDNAVKPAIKNDKFVITEISTDKKYGFDKDYPINLGFGREKDAPTMIQFFFNALLGEKNEKFTYTKLESCCPFPTKKTNVGAGTLDIYEIIFEPSGKKIQLYINIHEKGKIMCPKGFIINPS
jgi:hypothetical protein